MRWNGIEVKVDAQGHFNAKVDDVEIREATYEKAKERIDKALNSRTEIKKKAVRLAVLVISGDEDGWVAAIVTGVNRTTRELMFEGKPKTGSMHGAIVVADTEKNRAAADVLVETATRHDAAQAVVNKLQVFDRYKYGRIEPEAYMGVISRLEAAHAKSAKG